MSRHGSWRVAQRQWAGRPRRQSSLSLLPAKNLRKRLSGDQKGDEAPSVPASICAVSVSSRARPSRSALLPAPHGHEGHPTPVRRNRHRNWRYASGDRPDSGNSRCPVGRMTKRIGLRCLQSWPEIGEGAPDQRRETHDSGASPPASTRRACASGRTSRRRRSVAAGADGTSNAHLQRQAHVANVANGVGEGSFTRHRR